MPADPREPSRRELLTDVTQDRIWRYAKKTVDGVETVIEKVDRLRSGGGIWGTEADVRGNPCGGPRATPSWKIQKLFKCFPVFNYPIEAPGFNNSFSDDRPIGGRENGKVFYFHDGTDIGRAHCDGPKIRAPLDGFVLQTPAGVETRLARHTTRGNRCVTCLDKNKDKLSGRGGNYVYLLCRPEGMTFGQDEYLRIIFSHLAAPSPLQEGEFCRAGQEIGVMGNTGGQGGGVHLHIQCNCWKLLSHGPGFVTGDHKGRLIGQLNDPVNLYAALLWTRFMPAGESSYSLPSAGVTAALDTPIPSWAAELKSLPEWCPGENPPVQEQQGEGGEVVVETNGEAAVSLPTSSRYWIYTEPPRDPEDYVDYEEQGMPFPTCQ